MKSKARPEWNCLPGYTRGMQLIERAPHTGAALNALEVGLTEKGLYEFLKEPVESIVERIAKRARSGMIGTKDAARSADELFEIVLRMVVIAIVAEREGGDDALQALADQE